MYGPTYNMFLKEKDATQIQEEFVTVLQATLLNKWRKYILDEIIPQYEHAAG